jgi:cytoskeletal protein CcmA (bactofilin family)
MEPPSKPREPAVLSVLSGDLKAEGDIVSEGDLHISGTVKGDVVARKLTVGEGGSITGSVEADVAVIAGRIAGRLTATSVTLASTADVVADVTHVSLLIEQGAKCEGFRRRVETVDAVTDNDFRPPPRVNTPTHSQAQPA